MGSESDTQYVNLKVKLIKGDDGKITVGDVTSYEENNSIENQVTAIMNPNPQTETSEGNQGATTEATTEATTAVTTAVTPGGGKKRRTHRKKSRRNRRRRSIRYTRN